MKIPKLTVICVSESWTQEMQFNQESFIRLSIDFVWVSLKDQYDESKSQKIIESLKFTNLYHIQYSETFGNHLNTPLLYTIAGTLATNDSKSWFFSLDNDEILSYRDWLVIRTLVKFLRRRSTYAIPRNWIIEKESGKFRVRSARSRRSFYDWQYRLFNLYGIEPIARPHLPLEIKRKKRLYLGLRILHLAYKDSTKEREAKLRVYENVGSRKSHTVRESHYFPVRTTYIGPLKLNNFARIKYPTLYTLRRFQKNIPLVSVSQIEREITENEYSFYRSTGVSN